MSIIRKKGDVGRGAGGQLRNFPHSTFLFRTSHIPLPTSHFLGSWTLEVECGKWDVKCGKCDVGSGLWKLGSGEWEVT